MLVIEHHVAPGLHGLGLFTDEPLLAGQVVCNDDYRFIKVISLEEIATYPMAMQKHFDRHAYHGMGVDRLEDAVYYNMDDTRFINHADCPNLRYAKEQEIYVAVCDLPAGTELTCDYHDFCKRGDHCFDF